MHRKHFILLASILKKYHEAEKNGWSYNIYEAIADLCESESPSFDRDRFYKASGYNRVLRP